jgi:hypothetical protein
MSGLSDLRDRVLNLLATGNSFRPLRSPSIDQSLRPSNSTNPLIRTLEIQRRSAEHVRYSLAAEYGGREHVFDGGFWRP